MDANDITSIFDNLSSIPFNFLEPSALRTADAPLDLDLYNLQNVCPELDRPISIPFSERPPIPLLTFNQNLYSNSNSNSTVDANSIDDSSEPSFSPIPLPFTQSHQQQHHLTMTESTELQSSPSMLHSTDDLESPSISQLLSPTLIPKTKTKSKKHPKSNTRITPSSSIKPVIKKPNSLKPTAVTLPVPSTNDDTPTSPRGNVSHTRRCRAKVNNYFERLMEVLPPAPEGVEVRHKAQMLLYAVDTFHAVRQRNMQLEMQLALSSPAQMQRWVHSVVSLSKGNLNDALKPFMAMICLTKRWKYAELWSPSQPTATSTASVLKYVTGAVSPSVKGDELSRILAYRTKSKQFVFRPRSGVPGRVFLTKRPEWLPLLNDPVAFPRAPHAVDNNMEVTFAVPIIINGVVKMVVQFYDVQRRDYDPSTLHIANEIAELFGNAFTVMSSVT